MRIGPRSDCSYRSNPLGLHCLKKKLLKQLGRQQKQTTFFVVGTLRVNGYGAFDS